MSSGSAWGNPSWFTAVEAAQLLGEDDGRIADLVFEILVNSQALTDVSGVGPGALDKLVDAVTEDIAEAEAIANSTDDGAVKAEEEADRSLCPPFARVLPAVCPAFASCAARPICPAFARTPLTDSTFSLERLKSR